MVLDGAEVGVFFGSDENEIVSTLVEIRML